ncbi:MAG TPA: neutral/alkaline non-lysosomal ceramidase N-terminal domain-containing protein [Mycobacteriales bacterium]|nr:neutral/alkaline non-lysosomal ceramidase N-terminal domain-containing protein [Mycobacteriales bacterium]
MRRPRLLVALLLVLSSLTVADVVAGGTDRLRVGVGRADITSPTGYYMQGWVRSDAVLSGVHTRIQARAIVLQRGRQKLALVAEDLNSIAAGVVHEAAKRLASRGFSDANIIVSASHTHAAPSGYYPYNTYNTVFMTKDTPTAQNVGGTLDPQLYAFEIRQLVLAITRADDDLAPGKLGWATTTLSGLTANRSLEAHLRNHGVERAFGDGKVADDPKGYLDTIDPEVQVLRVDKTVRGRSRPVGMWSTFADHGTVNRFQFGVYNADHHGSATRLVEERIRALGGVPRGQDVVNAYGNTDEGDQSAGLTRSGPAAADLVGRVEAGAMLKAWADAGRRMTDTPRLATRWTRMCFCGQETGQGPVSRAATPGLPLITGSEEGRGPLHDLTQTPFEGDASPVDDPHDPAQGRKIPIPTNALGGGSTPTAVPLTVAQVGERLIATIPGEMTVAMGRLVRGALALIGRGHGITGVQLSGLANEYLSYFVTPQEYDAQHYEGGSTMYGRTSSLAVMQGLQLLAKALVSGRPAAPAYDEDPTNGVAATAAPFGTGATAASVRTQPATTQRLARAAFSWQAGPQGLDMPLGRAFVSLQRVGRGVVADDLGLQVMWRVDENGVHTAQWEVPRDAPRGRYRFVVTANHYRLVSASFAVVPATTLSVVGRTVRYPDPVVNVDLTWRPALADGGRLVAHGGAVAPGGARDRYGNCNGAAATTSGTRSGADASADPAICG